MQIHISTGDGVPIYLQIANQVKYLVAAGRLAAGDEIPPIRVLAHQLLINPNTVARAYLELERDGVVQKRHGSGTYISSAGSPLARKERLKILSERVDALVAEARHFEVDPAELLQLVKERSQSIQPKEGK
ncbi:MAG: GntR family transcriptional regulator [Verrucomicrobia bacterium]|nr:GntR family transcriptional regulator [Verrucomicrobiota bacterium]